MEAIVTSGKQFIVGASQNGSMSRNGHHADKLSIPVPLIIADSLYHNIDPPTGSKVRCQHCDRVAFAIVSDSIVVEHRHNGQWHKTVVSLRDLGYRRVDDDG